MSCTAQLMNITAVGMKHSKRLKCIQKFTHRTALFMRHIALFMNLIAPFTRCGGSISINNNRYFEAKRDPSV